MKHTWEQVLNTVSETMEPTLKRQRDESHLPCIVNLVTTVSLLPQNFDLPKRERYNLPLNTIAAKWGCSQYAPRLFAANIIKQTDSIAASTALLFVSGIMVVVSCLSLNHARYVSQHIRLCIERTRCIMRKESDVIYEGTLMGRTTFNKCVIHNIVGHGSVGMRIDLQALVSGAPDCWKWTPDLFPGAKGKLWLTESKSCTCRALPGTEEEEEEKVLRKLTGKKQKCMCAVKVLMFDSGKFVITGAHDVESVNRIYLQIQSIANDYESDLQETLPKEERFYHRLNTMMIPLGTSLKKATPVVRMEMKPNEAMACLLAGITAPAGEHGTTNHNLQDDRTPLMRMAEAGRVENVQMTLLMFPDQIHQQDTQGQTALQRLLQMPHKTAEILEIIDILTEASVKN
jgi:TATA-box binding protein (TBP) (component of TFIID and TFIIIB)